MELYLECNCSSPFIVQLYLPRSLVLLIIPVPFHVSAIKVIRKIIHSIACRSCPKINTVSLINLVSRKEGENA